MMNAQTKNEGQEAGAMTITTFVFSIFNTVYLLDTGNGSLS